VLETLQEASERETDRANNVDDVFSTPDDFRRITL